MIETNQTSLQVRRSVIKEVIIAQIANLLFEGNIMLVEVKFETRKCLMKSS